MGVADMHVKLTIALIPMLLFLGWLQYVMVGKVSRAEAERTRAGLKTAVTRFSHSFDRELIHTWMSFAKRASDPAGSGGAQVLGMWADWKDDAEFPGLIRDIYRIDKAQGFSIRRLNPEDGEYEDVDWPDSLAAFRDEVTLKGRSFEDMVRGQMAIPEGPALLVPILQGRIRQGPESALALVLDTDYLKQVWLPELTARHVNPEGRDDFVVSIRASGDPKPLFYRSAEVSSRGARETVDESATLFDLHRMLTSDTPKRLGLPRSWGRHVKSQIQKRRPPMGEHQLWTLEASHRAGSLEAYLKLNRRQNLAVNFIVLAILAASVGLLVRSTNRERRLAHQQISFVAGVSHELLTPLAAIRSAGQNLSDGVVVGEDRVRRYGTMIEKEGGRLADLVEKVLAFAGMQSERDTYRMEHLSLPQVLDEVLNDHQVVLQEAGFEVELNVPKNLPPIFADKSALKKVIGNLLGNGVKYAFRDPRLFIRARAEGENVVLEIEDRGPGIDPQDLPHIFEPFYRGKGVRDAQIKGSGLGLCLVHNMVAAHGGKTEVVPGSEGGCVFRTTWPQANGAQATRVVAHKKSNYRVG